MSVTMTSRKISFILVISTINIVQCLGITIDSSFQNKIPDQLQDTFNEKAADLHSQVEKFLEECETNHGSEVTDRLKESVTNLFTCGYNLLNFTEINKEIEDAIPKGALDEVFHSHCNRIPDLKACYRNVVESVKVCLDDVHKLDFDIGIAAFEEGLNFICHKGGMHIAIFLAEGGQSCWSNSTDRLRECATKMLSEMEESSTPTDSSVFTLHYCSIENNFKTCVVDKLKMCKDPTPANIVEGLIDSMVKKTPCYKSGGVIKQTNPWFSITILFLSLYMWNRKIVH